MDTDVRIRITRVVDPDELGQQIEPKMRNLGQAIGARMQRLVPKRTWALHDTITTGTTRTGARVVTEVGFGGGDVDYGLHVERGTSRMRAQPFARPAFAQTTGQDLNFKGRGIITHGVTSVTTRRSRVKSRGGNA